MNQRNTLDMQATNQRSKRRPLALTLGLLAALGSAAPALAASPFPNAQTSAADPRLVQIIDGYLQKKSARDLNGTMSYFSPRLTAYTDATLGLSLPGYDAVKGLFAQFMPNWPASARSYPTRILGNSGSAIVALTDTPELFGGEIRALSAIDLVGGKIVRQVDYWDASSFDPALFQKLSVPADKYPTDFKESQVVSSATPGMVKAATALQQAYGAGNAQAAGQLLGDDVVYEDMALRTQVIGRAAVTRYLGRVLNSVPYGQASQLRHVLGGPRGGGFEWFAGPQTGVHVGITALELDASGKISRVTTVYNTTNLTPAQKDALTAASREP